VQIPPRPQRNCRTGGWNQNQLLRPAKFLMWLSGNSAIIRKKNKLTDQSANNTAGIFPLPKKHLRRSAASEGFFACNNFAQLKRLYAAVDRNYSGVRVHTPTIRNVTILTRWSPRR